MLWIKKTLSFYYLFIQHINAAQLVGLDGNIYSMQGQAALTALTDVTKELCNFLYCVFVGWELTVFVFVRGEYEKT